MPERNRIRPGTTGPDDGAIPVRRPDPRRRPARRARRPGHGPAGGARAAPPPPRRRSCACSPTRPGDVLLRHDPAVTAVVCAERGRERAAVLAELDRWRPDLAVTTTRYDGIADAIEELVPQSVTNLWRSPPPDEPVSARYLRILAAEDVIDPRDVDLPPRIVLTGAERAEGEQVLGSDEQSGRSCWCPSAGMAVKEWPHWRRAGDGAGRPRVRRRGARVLDAWRGGPARLLPAAVVARARGACSPRWVGAAAWSSARTRARCGWRRRSARAPSGSSARRSAARYGLGPPGVDLQGLPDCPHRRPTAITEQVCWWEAPLPAVAARPGVHGRRRAGPRARPAADSRGRLAGPRLVEPRRGSPPARGGRRSGGHATARRGSAGSLRTSAAAVARVHALVADPLRAAPAPARARARARDRAAARPPRGRQPMVPATVSAPPRATHSGHIAGPASAPTPSAYPTTCRTAGCRFQP